MVNQKKTVIGLIIVSLTIIGLNIPIIEINALEEYTEAVPYEVDENYTITEYVIELVPYTVIIEKNETIFYQKHTSLLTWQDFAFTTEIDAKSRIELTFESESLVDAYIVRNNTDFVAELHSVTSGVLAYNVTEQDAYGFIIRNAGDGNTFDVDNTYLKRTYIDEIEHLKEETIAQNVTKTRAVIEYRDELKYRTVSKKITILQSIMGLN